MISLEKLPCPYCGSEVEWRGEAVLTCPYCGTAFTRQGSVGDHLMERVNYEPGEVFRLFTQWALRMPETPNDFALSASLTRCQLEFHPYWLYEINGVFAWSGVRAVGIASTPFRLLPESFVPEASASEEVLETMNVIVSLPGLRRSFSGPLANLKLGLGGKVYFSYRYVKEKGGTLYNPDIPPEEADRSAVIAAQEEAARRLSRRLGKGAAVRMVEKKTFSRRLVHVPIYNCMYSYAGNVYRFVAEAASSRILYAEVPKEAKFRAAAGFAGALFVTSAAVIFLLSFPELPFFALSSSAGLLISGAYSIAKALSSTVTVRQFYA